jgi:hypothetical protein
MLVLDYTQGKPPPNAAPLYGSATYVPFDGLRVLRRVRFGDFSGLWAFSGTGGESRPSNLPVTQTLGQKERVGTEE